MPKDKALLKLDDDEDKENLEKEEKKEKEEKDEKKEDTGKAVKEDKNGDVFVTIEDKGGDDDEPHITAAEKRRNRYREQQELRAAAEARAQQLADENARLRNMVLQPPQPPPQPQTPVKDRIETDLESVRKEQIRLYEIYTMHAKDGSLTEEQKDRYLRDAEALEERKQELYYLKAQRKYTPPVNPAMQQVEQLKAANMDVFNHPKASLYAQGIWYQKRAMGKPDNQETFDEVMEETRKQYKIGPYRNMPASESTKTKYTGVPRSGGSQAGGDNGSKTTIKMTKEMRKMADTMYSHIKSQDERYQRWANGPGREVIRDMEKEKEAE